MKLRIKPIAITALVTATLLFGGWFAYRIVAMERPMNDLLAAIEGIDEYETVLGSDQVTLNLVLSNQANIREIVHTIKREAASVIGSKKLVIHLESDTSSELEEWWSSALFDVAEAMETRTYSAIPEKLMEKAAPGMKVDTWMDDEYVYVALTLQDHAKFILLPRTPVQLGVWSGE